MEIMKTIWNEKSIEYSNECELKCDNFFGVLTGKTNWFHSVSKNPDFSKIDYQFEDTNNDSGSAELKIRSCSIKKYNEIFLERDKYEELKNSTMTGKTIYINWFSNSEEKFWVLDIKNIINEDLKIWYNVPISINKLGTYYTYHEDRILIPRHLGTYYELDKITNKYKKIIL